MFLALLLGAACLQDAGTGLHLGDGEPLVDPMRPVTRIARDSFTIQYFTSQPCSTRLQVREGEMPMVAFKAFASSEDPWKGALTVEIKGNRTWHTITVAGLKPGRRHFYRISDPGAKPTREEKNWGATPSWSREYAVSTLAPAGQRTVIHLPIKVLIMPNVINVASAHNENGAIAPQPAKLTEAEIQKIKDEFAVSARFLWVASGMRLWVDYRFFVDDRWQRWSEEPANADAFYKGWIPCRSWPKKDYEGPGGGAFTVLDTKDPLRVNTEPVVEARPYSGQVELACARRWNASAKQWEFYNSGGGTYGVDSLPQGFPGRSQFLGGGDIAWLATHEFHHDLESHGQFSLAFREDERIVFNHYAPRKRTAKPDGTFDEWAWSTSGRHGEHWDGMAFWDRTLSDAQWLRLYFGYTITVRDADADGFPDDDPRLPLDEKRFGSDPKKRATDGAMGDLEKAMLSNWAPAPLQPTWIKPAFQAVKPNPTKPDTDGDGLPDGVDPYPLYPWAPFIYPGAASIDGDASEWNPVPPCGTVRRDGLLLEYKHLHDDDGYYGLLRLSGPWKRANVTLDGEGFGVYSGQGVLGFEVFREGEKIDVRKSFLPLAGLVWKTSSEPDGTTVFEFKLPNRGEGPWFWDRGGREIGVVLSLFDTLGRGYSVYEPYRPFYCRMLESRGAAPRPPVSPAELGTGPDVVVLRPGDTGLKAQEGWKVEGARLSYEGQEERALYVEGLAATEFDLWVRIEAKQDAVLGAFTAANEPMSAGRDYVGFIGGYGNTITRIRVFGNEKGDGERFMTPGEHTIQLTRRAGEVWLLLDGQPQAYTSDPNPKAVVSRLAVIGGYGGGQVVHEVRYRAK